MTTNNMKYHNNLKINTNIDSILPSKTPRVQNVFNTGNSKPQYSSDSHYSSNDVNVIYNRFSTMSIKNDKNMRVDENSQNPNGKFRNTPKIEDSKSPILRSYSRGVFENKRSFNVFDSNTNYNHQTQPSFLESNQPKTTRHYHKPLDNKFIIKENHFSPPDTKDNNSDKNSNKNNFIKGEARNIITRKYDTNNEFKNNKIKSEIFSNDLTNSKNFNFLSKDKTRESINVLTLVGDKNLNPLSINNLNLNFPNYNNSRFSGKSMATIKAYAANTYQGLVRNYNEDRVSIILNIVKPSSYKADVWPKCSFFGIYDGHGGSSCADFLRDKLHQYIVKDPNFPFDVSLAIKNSFEAADKDFLTNVAVNKDGEVIDRSGSCAIIALFVDNICYIANVGDSRAILSIEGGKKTVQLSNDHKPNEYLERKRIIEEGGSVYQSQTPARNFNVYSNTNNSNQIILGPYRVFPGRLSVSRAFGNIEAKLPKYGGNQKVLISIPEVKAFEITKDYDFLIIGCDGIFDQLSNKDINDCVWMTTNEMIKSKSLHHQCGLGVDMIIKSSLSRKSLDNVTCLMIAFENYARILNLSEKNYDQKNLHENVMSSFNSHLDHPNYSTSRIVNKQNFDSISRPKTNSFISNFTSPQTISNSNDQDLFQPQSSYNYQNKLPRKSSPACLIRTQKKISLEFSPIIDEEKYLSYKQPIKTGQKNLSFLDKYKISPFSTYEINDYHPYTSKNSDMKYKTYNNQIDLNKKFTYKKGF